LVTFVIRFIRVAPERLGPAGSPALRLVHAFPWNDDLPPEVSIPTTALAWFVADRIVLCVFSPREAAASVLRSGMYGFQGVPDATFE
jgi:hypothetical protein